jgi:hypothetical protein
VDPAFAISLPAPSSSTTTASSLESAIGEAMLLASAAIAQAIYERGSTGRVGTETSRQGTELLVQLYTLRRVCIDEGLDFDHIARSQGKRAIVRRWDQLKHVPDRPYIELTAVTLDEMVSWPLALLAKIIRTRMH